MVFTNLLHQILKAGYGNFLLLEEFPQSNAVECTRTKAALFSYLHYFDEIIEFPEHSGRQDMTPFQ